MMLPALAVAQAAQARSGSAAAQDMADDPDGMPAPDLIQALPAPPPRLFHRTRWMSGRRRCRPERSAADPNHPLRGKALALEDDRGGCAADFRAVIQRQTAGVTALPQDRCKACARRSRSTAGRRSINR
jgi:hypothetical protein